MDRETLECANCDGLGYVVNGWTDMKCPDCDGWGRLLDINSYELDGDDIAGEVNH